VTVKTGVTSSALPWYITSRVRSEKRQGLSEIEQACLALEVDDMPCPMDVDPEDWVRSNFAYICEKYKEKYPRPSTIEKKVKPSKNQRKKQRLKARQAAQKKTVFVSNVNVATDSFLSTYEWRKLRMQALKLHGRKCMCCGASPETGAVMNVDHIKPRKLFPSLAMDINNLQVLCHECNHGKGNWDQTDWRK